MPVSLTPNPDPLIESVTVCPDVTNGIWIGTLQGSVFRYTKEKSLLEQRWHVVCSLGAITVTCAPTP